MAMEIDGLPPSRNAAAAIGAKRYFTGRPCRAGHVSVRFMPAGNCSDCMRVWRRKNSRSLQAKLRNWQKRNPERVKSYKKRKPWLAREYRAKYYAKNIDALRACGRARAAERRRLRPDAKRENQAKRRASKLSATPRWVDRTELKRIYAACPRGLVVDHIVPLMGKEVCGLHVPWNLQYLTRSENSSKNNRLVVAA